MLMYFSRYYDINGKVYTHIPLIIYIVVHNTTTAHTNVVVVHTHVVVAI